MNNRGTKLFRLFSVTCFIVSFALLSACVTTRVNSEQDEKMVNYLSNLRAQVEILWHKEVITEVNDLRAKGMVPARLNAPDAEVQVLVNVTEAGEVQSFEILKKSKYKFLNSAIKKSIKDASPFPPPPKEGLENRILKIRWDFILKS